MRLNRLLSVVVACVLLFSAATAYVTADEPALCLNNTVEVSTISGIEDDGLLYITYDYTGNPDHFTKAVITIYIERRTLGFFWTRVDIGQPDNQWVDTSYYYMGCASHSVQLTQRGEFRIKALYKIYGTGGTADEIPYERTDIY